MNPRNHWRPSAEPDRIKARARLLENIRSFFSERDVTEVETPLISNTGNPEPEIHSIRTDAGGYLRTSPEFALKRMLAAGYGDVDELGRVFRAGESGRFHNPEFTLLEWYRNGMDYHRLMDEVAALVRHCGGGHYEQWPETRVSYHELFLRHLDVDPFTTTSENLAKIAGLHGITDIELNRKQWLDLLISHVIQPALPAQSLMFVYDYPADQAALANVRDDARPVAERFELFLGTIELANGYQELTDAAEQNHRFEQQNEQRQSRGESVVEIDHHLIDALAHGMEKCAGVALGVDRLMMSICGADSLNEVIAFPHSRA